MRNEKSKMKTMQKTIFVLFCIIFCGSISAQSFGFGDDEEVSVANNAINVSIGGEVSASLLGYTDDISDGTSHIRLGDIFNGKLNFSAKTSIADGIINLKLSPSKQPVSIDEAYVRAYFGSFEIEGGLRKLTWGKADSLGPLDVINPLDYSELTDLSDMMNLKIARPLIHASYRIGSFSKIEGVFVPWFEPLRYATEGRWVPSQMKLLASGVPVTSPDTSTLEYAQGGLRFTTTIGPADFGIQYYYGRLTRPAVAFAFAPTMPPTPTALLLAYNPYHQFGVDWAQVLFGFNIRAELAANITGDMDGNDGSVYNPALLGSLGFDRDLFMGINLNFQCNESIRLMNNKVADNPMLDIEAGKDMTSTQIIAALSKKFLRDELEARIAGIFEIEDSDFLFMPSLTWTKDSVSVELSGGIFGGKKEGQFGQYSHNNFIKAALTYSF